MPDTIDIKNGRPNPASNFWHRFLKVLHIRQQIV